ncbi:MAG: hypothetical protein EOP49_06570 [Sphingobacteriales bacterium]|nr:MAG: hypothetical protein EOP49_06570 [Sphingobacteriales bacterium]
MEIEIFTLCDFAQEWGGKLFINGTFDMINARSFPTTLNACTIAGKLRFSNKETGEHEFRLKIVDSTGKDLVQPIQGNINVPESPAFIDYSTIHFAVNLMQFQIPAAGSYAIELYLDGEWESGLKLTAVQQQQ